MKITLEHGIGKTLWTIECSVHKDVQKTACPVCKGRATRTENKVRYICAKCKGAGRYQKTEITYSWEPLRGTVVGYSTRWKKEEKESTTHYDVLTCERTWPKHVWSHRINVKSIALPLTGFNQSVYSYFFTSKKEAEKFAKRVTKVYWKDGVR